MHPAGAGLGRSPPAATLGGVQAPERPRLLAGLAAAACLSLLAVSAWLSPSGDGHGTHTQLGMPPCGWVLAVGKPCATCGMTTAFAHAAEGDFVASFVTQPMGMLLALLTSSVFWAAAYQLITGSRVDAAFARLLRPRMLVLAGLVLLASWGYKVLTW